MKASLYEHLLTPGSGTNNQEEKRAAIFCIFWAFEIGYRKIILEMNYMLRVNWILQKLILSRAFAINFTD